MNAMKVKDELDSRGWAKLTTMTPGGQVCLNGAQLTAGLDKAERASFCALACQAIAELFPDRVFPEAWFRQQYFNDHPDTTREDVDLVIARIIELEAS